MDEDQAPKMHALKTHFLTNPSTLLSDTTYTVTIDAENCEQRCIQNSA